MRRTKVVAAGSLAGILAGTAAWAAPPRPWIDDGAALCAESKAALSARPPRAPASGASTNIDITYYHLALTVDFGTNAISGVVRVEGTVTGAPMSMLTLDLKNNMTVSAVSLAAGGALAFSRVGDLLNITLPATVPVSGTVAVDVTYSGTPMQTGFGSFVFGTRFGDRLAWSLSEPYGARDWWPCKDHPSDKADSVRVTVTTPSQYRVGSQGLLVSETTVGPNKVYDWKSSYPISNYLVSVAIGEYVQHSATYVRPAGLASQYGPLSLPIQHLVYDDGTTALPLAWSNVTDALEVLEDWFGPYPFASEKYGHSETTFGGGMEHQTMTSLGGVTLPLVVHELGHQWYGDLISPKTWPHLWLNEGFATYAELLYYEARASQYPGQFEGQLASRYNSALNAVGTLVLEDTTSVTNMFTYSRVYAKGAVVLHMLRKIVGDVVFRNILKSYAADPAVQYGVATTDDFHRVAEAESGMDLDYFFSQWVTDGYGYPFYRSFSFWQAAPGGGHDVWTTVEQFQTPPYSNVDVFEMPLDIAVQTTGGEERVRVYNDQRHQVFEIHVSDEPTSVAIDPDYWILRPYEIFSGVRGTPSLLTIASLAPNPTSEWVRVEYALSREGRVDVEVFDVAGRRVLARPGVVAGAGPRVETVDVRPLAAGVYFLRVKAVEGSAVRKFVVVR
jgi:aminopeptidase N